MLLNKHLFYRFEVEIFSKEKLIISKEELIEKIKGKHGIFCSLNEKIDSDVLKSAGIFYFKI